MLSAGRLMSPRTGMVKSTYSRGGPDDTFGIDIGVEWEWDVKYLVKGWEGPGDIKTTLGQDWDGVEISFEKSSLNLSPSVPRHLVHAGHRARLPPYKQRPEEREYHRDNGNRKCIPATGR